MACPTLYVHKHISVAVQYSPIDPGTYYSHPQGLFFVFQEEAPLRERLQHSWMS